MVMSSTCRVKAATDKSNGWGGQYTSHAVSAILAEEVVVVPLFNGAVYFQHGLAGYALVFVKWH